MIGLGVVTYNRPDMAEKCVKSIMRTCADEVDVLYVYNDGSDTKYRGAYSRAYKPLLSHKNGRTIVAAQNGGVAKAKNTVLRQMIADGCDWLLLCEDDLKILDAKAITRYVEVCKAQDLHHLSFAHHGPANAGVPDSADDVSYFPHSIGAWAVFSRECLLECGLFDEFFCNAWEHVEHELRLIRDGWMPGADAYQYPDVTGSAEWITEQPNSIEKSSIRPRDDWSDNIRNGLIYWRDNKPDTFDMLFGPDKPLFAYAQRIIDVGF